MDNDQITALARESGECVANNPALASYLEAYGDKDVAVKANARRAKDVIEWMDHQFFIVDRSKLLTVYNLTWNTWRHTPDMGIKERTRSVLDTLESIFPEIAKEEG